MMITDCKICNIEFKDQPALIRHIKKFHIEYMNYEEYVIAHFYNGIKPTCKCGCGTPLKFESHSSPNFYAQYTKNHWPHKPHTEKAKKQIKETFKKTMLDKYGVENIMELPEYIEKIKKTKLDRYEDETYNNPTKTKQTNLDRYGVEYPQQNLEIKEKSKETNFKKYNAPTFTATPEGKLQVKKTKKDKYGDENYINIEKCEQTKLDRYGYKCEFLDQKWRNKYNFGDSKIQLRICDELGIEKFTFNGHVFDGKFFNFLVEVDGSRYHARNLNNLTLTTLNSIQNDFKKAMLVSNSQFELIRIISDDFKRMSMITFEDIWINSYEQDFTFDFYTIFLTKKYLENLSADTKLKYWRIFLKFIKLFQPTFPIIPTKERLSDTINKIQIYPYSNIENKTFNNNTSNIGVSLLKSKFRSYWKSSYKDTLSPVDAWNDDRIMERVIKYRIGLNRISETFNFSLHQLVRGLSALRHTVSFFKPILAATIYKHFIGEKLNPIVFDPCCGFGGRLLGFKSLYPEGTYIGCEPNIDTFNELMELSQNFTNVFLYNCKIEEFDLSLLPENLDLTFTSIPYFDLETYSNPVEYNSFDEWKDTFLIKINQCPKLIVNIPNSLRKCFEIDANEYYIQSNTSHFNKKENKKIEFLLDLRK